MNIQLEFINFTPTLRARDQALKYISEITSLLTNEADLRSSILQMHDGYAFIEVYVKSKIKCFKIVDTGTSVDCTFKKIIQKARKLS